MPELRRYIQIIAEVNPPLLFCYKVLANFNSFVNSFILCRTREHCLTWQGVWIFGYFTWEPHRPKAAVLIESCSCGSGLQVCVSVSSFSATAVHTLLSFREDTDFLKTEDWLGFGLTVAGCFTRKALCTGFSHRDQFPLCGLQRSQSGSNPVVFSFWVCHFGEPSYNIMCLSLLPCPDSLWLLWVFFCKKDVS